MHLNGGDPPLTRCLVQPWGAGVAANAFAQSILGFDAKTIAETDLSAQIVEEEEGSFTKAWATALGGEAAPVQCGLRKLNGNSVPTIGDLTFCPNKAGGGQVFLVARVDAPLDNMLELKGRAKAIDRSQVVVEFDLDGNVLTANDNFLELMGYSLGEISGKHHSMFCDEDFTGSSAYSGFWSKLRSGTFFDGEYKRVGRGGRDVWVRASYNPVLNSAGVVTRVIMTAMDVTKTKLAAVESSGKVAAMERGQAVIEFDLQGNILEANPTFLDLMGYDREDVVGQHHRMFCDEEHAKSSAYKQFWQKLGRGEFETGEYKRYGRDGKQVWIKATYNPVFDLNGHPTKVIKFALDVTLEKLKAAEFESKVNAISRAQAVIEFDLRGNILTANEQFLRLMDYTIEEIRGRHHKIFCDPAYAASDDYIDFWRKLGRGEYEGGEYKRLTKGGVEVWLQSTYNPVFDMNGVPVKVVKFASDTTAAKVRNAEFEGKVTAINRSQCVIEFDLKGNILSANQNFLSRFGYSIESIRGRHHRIFCEPAHAQSETYLNFWDKLSRGGYESGEYKRITCNGEEIWIQATYNPIFDLEGRPVKIVKFATDVTAAKMKNVEFESRVAAVDRSQAVIEFDPDGKVLNANENFLRMMGFTLREVVGQHHSTLCTADYIRSTEYRDFWLRLSKGEFHSGRFMRIGKFNREVHIQACYSPIHDLKGDVVRVIKYAHDITDQIELERRIASQSMEMMHVVESLTQSISEITRNTHSATVVANETQTNAEQGYEALNNAIQAIELIQRSSGEISDIVKVIGEIASQTNLLAFNAAIEAARAGDHGVGFSVVAGEVRRLAERSSQAAREIANLINESVKRVNQGSDRSQHAKAAFEQIVGSVGKTGTSIREIANSAVAQQAASQNVAKLMGELSAAVAR